MHPTCHIVTSKTSRRSSSPMLMASGSTQPRSAHRTSPRFGVLRALPEFLVELVVTSFLVVEVKGLEREQEQSKGPARVLGGCGQLLGEAGSVALRQDSFATPARIGLRRGARARFKGLTHGSTWACPTTGCQRGHHHAGSSPARTTRSNIRPMSA